MKIAEATAMVLVCAVAANAAPTGAGHWEGAIQISGHSVSITLDLTGTPLAGTVAFPDQKLAAVPVSNLKLAAGEFSFESRDWLFAVQAKLSPDGASIAGDFISAHLLTVPVPIRLTRTGNARLEEPPRSTPLTKSLEGDWEGVLALGPSFEKEDRRSGSATVRLTLRNGPEGATGVLAKPGAKAAPMPLTAIRQVGVDLRFEVRGAGATFDGRIGPNGIAGEWRQFDFGPARLQLQRATTK